jgi:hypothetical protein
VKPRWRLWNLVNIETSYGFGFKVVGLRSLLFLHQTIGKVRTSVDDYF